MIDPTLEDMELEADMKSIPQAADEPRKGSEGSLQLVQDDELLAVVDEAPPLLECTEAVCFCFKIERTLFPEFQTVKLVFYFRVLEPHQHKDLVLKMYVSDQKGKRLPVRSKLYQIARVAFPDLKKRTRITNSMFLKKIFRCRLGTTKTPVPYTVIRTLMERIAG